jgi:hypothetical protein
MNWMAKVAAVGALLLALLVPARALASNTQMSVLQDDDRLIFANPDHVARSLDQIAALGVDTLRVSVIWAAVAPDPTSPQRPSFDAADPAAYPAGAWDRYDTLVRLAAARGIAVNFVLTGPIPRWASQGVSPVPSFVKDFDPSASAFARFVHAVSWRYDGHYVAAPAPPPPPPPDFLGLPLPLGSLFGYPPQPASPQPLPRVNSWSIWNEPNEGGWLTPQWRHAGRARWTERAPAVYRGLVDAGVAALDSTGHGGDQILIGETAARGTVRRCAGCSMRPMLFLRALYCVGGAYRPLTGARARALGCPASGDSRAFAAAHPALLSPTGYAHHPYSFESPPGVSDPDPQDAPLANLSRLETGLDRIYAVYGRPPGLPIYLTEYGYKSDPPNPFARFSTLQQAAFINQGEYMAFQDPRVRSMAQFLLVDDLPKAGTSRGSRSYWSTFQTGLVSLNGEPKPAFAAYRIPIWLPDPRHGAKADVWGQLRPATRGTVQSAQVQFRAAGGAAFATLRTVQTSNPRGFVLAHVLFPTRGQLRLSWRDPASGIVYDSRTAPIR